MYLGEFFSKARRGQRDAVVANRQTGKGVVAGGIGEGCDFCVGRLVLGGDLSAGQTRARGVSDETGQTCHVHLRNRSRGNGKQRQAEAEGYRALGHNTPPGEGADHAPGDLTKAGMKYHPTRQLASELWVCVVST